MNNFKLLTLVAIFLSQTSANELATLCIFEPDRLVFGAGADSSVAFELVSAFNASKVKLGEGANGLVKQVMVSKEDPVFIPAVKMIDMKWLTDEEIKSKKDSIASEVATLQEVNLKNIGPRFFGCLLNKPKVYIMLELFNDRIGDPKFKVANHFKSGFERLDLISDIFRAVMELWQAGFIHGDIKPDNLVLNNQKSVVLVDFGTAQKFREKNNFLGTPLYMCKEKHSEPILYVETDLYAAILTAAQIFNNQVNIFKKIRDGEEKMIEDGEEEKSLSMTCFLIAQPEYCYSRLAYNVLKILKNKAFESIGEHLAEDLAKLLSQFIENRAGRSYVEFFKEYCKLTAGLRMDKVLERTTKLCDLFGRPEKLPTMTASQSSQHRGAETYDLQKKSNIFAEVVGKLQGDIVKRVREELKEGGLELLKKKGQKSSLNHRKGPETKEVLLVENLDDDDDSSNKKYEFLKSEQKGKITGAQSGKKNSKHFLRDQIKKILNSSRFDRPGSKKTKESLTGLSRSQNSNDSSFAPNDRSSTDLEEDSEFGVNDERDDDESDEEDPTNHSSTNFTGNTTDRKNPLSEDFAIVNSDQRNILKTVMTRFKSSTNDQVENGTLKRNRIRII